MPKNCVDFPPNGQDYNVKQALNEDPLYDTTISEIWAKPDKASVSRCCGCVSLAINKRGEYYWFSP